MLKKKIPLSPGLFLAGLVVYNEWMLHLWITDGVKGMFQLFGATSDQNVRFCDMIFEGSLQ